MEAINKLINEFYEKYKGLPSNNPIVRMNQKNDAFELVVFDTLYGEEKELDLIENSSKIADELSKYIVAPPDDGVDIVVEHEDIEGNIFDFVQVKNKKLSDLELKQAFLYMEDTAKRCSKNIEQVGTNLKEVLANTGFSRGDARNTHFIVVHTGEKNYFKDQKANWQIITLTELELVRNNKNIALPKVPTEEFNSDSFNNFIMYEEDAGNPAILMNLRAYDLAKMSIKYANSSLGRNVLFGQNLRDSLIKKSATYDGMVDTIINTPEKFWFYNNGITIIAEDFEIKKDSTSNVEKLILKNFSIINGAQTTSAFGRFYKDMDNNRREEDLKKLKNVYVLARVLKINDEEFKSNIAIYNNTQNPITSRDMAANRYEQRTIYNKLLNGTPHIYMEYRRGTTILCACGPSEYAAEKNGHGIFTSLMVEALYGGAMNLLGEVTPGSIYSYIDSSLGAWDEQRPLFKANISSFVSLRKNAPPISITDLRKITQIFKSKYEEYPLDPTYEPDKHEADNKEENKEHEAIFSILQKYVKLNLVVPVGEEHMYYAAINNKSCKLTAQGQHYWQLVDKKMI